MDEEEIYLKTPRRFKSAFIIYSASRHNDVKAELEAMGMYKKTTDIAKMLSAEWGQLSAKEKAKWQAQSRLDKARYDEEKILYKAATRGNTNKRISKDRDAPKRPVSAYLAYSNSRRAGMKKKYPEANNGELSKLLSKQWTEATDEEKEEYIKVAALAKAKYKIDIADYRQKKANFNKWKTRRKQKADENGPEYKNNNKLTIASMSTPADLARRRQYVEAMRARKSKRPKDDNSLASTSSKRQKSDSSEEQTTDDDDDNLTASKSAAVSEDEPPKSYKKRAPKKAASKKTASKKKSPEKKSSKKKTKTKENKPEAMTDAYQQTMQQQQGTAGFPAVMPGAVFFGVTPGQWSSLGNCDHGLASVPVMSMNIPLNGLTGAAWGLGGVGGSPNALLQQQPVGMVEVSEEPPAKQRRISESIVGGIDSDDGSYADNSHADDSHADNAPYLEGYRQRKLIQQMIAKRSKNSQEQSQPQSPPRSSVQGQAEASVDLYSTMLPGGQVSGQQQQQFLQQQAYAANQNRMMPSQMQYHHRSMGPVPIAPGSSSFHPNYNPQQRHPSHGMGPPNNGGFVHHYGGPPNGGPPQGGPYHQGGPPYGGYGNGPFFPGYGPHGNNYHPNQHY